MSVIDTAMVAGRVVPARPRAKPSQRPVKLTFEPGRNAARVMFLIAGTLLVICSAVLWILPDPGIDADLVIMKLVASLSFLFCGLALLMRNHDEAKPEVHFDPKRRERRVAQRNNQGRMETVLKRSYDSFGAVYLSTGEIERWNDDGTPFLTLPVTEDETRRELRAQLGPLCA